MNLALLTAALQGDNSGDAIIESAVTRLLATSNIRRFPLTIPLTDSDIESINACDALIVCGTNLYQHVFACNLTVDVVARIRVPIIPFGIGTSARAGEIPAMDRAGVEAVRAIHRTCRVSSVRDEASRRFLSSIGIENTVLTGCPVLFHGLGTPEFAPSGEGPTLTPRARLLHIDEAWNARQDETLEVLAARYRPTLVLQSPYDVPGAERLASRHGLPIFMDPTWQAAPYIELARRQALTMGFRLHFSMLSIAYGKPSFVVGHDSRVVEFCKLVGLPVVYIEDYSDALLTLSISARSFPADPVRRAWDELAGRMTSFMRANDLPSTLEGAPRRTVGTLPPPARPRRKPRVLLLVDTPDWAFDHSARSLARELSRDFRFDVRYVREEPRLDPAAYDLAYVYFWGETWPVRFGFDPERTIRQVSSHRWEDDPAYGPCTPTELAARYLADAGTVACTSRRLARILETTRPRVCHVANGVDTARFHLLGPRTGALRVGWAGRAEDPVKGFTDILEPACRGRFDLRSAPGGLPHGRMNAFYNGVDVFAVASHHEGEPLTLLEAMAAGCFPVCVDVGVVPELVRHEVNGLIVAERSSAAFAAALEWCEARLPFVREAGQRNARWMARERSWRVCAPYFKRVFLETLDWAERPLLRNDDVSWDTPLQHFREFCAIFERHGLVQVHGITLHGRTSTVFRKGDDPVEYEGEDNLSTLDNTAIRRLSEGKEFAQRGDLIDFLSRGPDEIALHGLYHTDYARMSLEEQSRDMGAGLAILRRLFPDKPVRYFIAPFNRVNEETPRAAARAGLTVLAGQGVHLEEALDRLSFEPRTWYRYHHHRFYPESAFSYYRLSLEALDRALDRVRPLFPRDLGLRPPGAGKIPRARVRLPRPVGRLVRAIRGAKLR